jgi:hypothetical protein
MGVVLQPVDHRAALEASPELAPADAWSCKMLPSTTTTCVQRGPTGLKVDE